MWISSKNLKKELSNLLMDIPQDELRLMLQGAARLAPRNAKQVKRPPITVDDLKIIRANLNMNDPCDAAIFACMAVTFYCVARLGEFTVPNIRENLNPRNTLHEGASPR